MGFVYVGLEYTAKYSGGVWRSEACERCGRPFHYYVFLSATGSGHSPYFLDNAGARGRAASRAQERLVRDLVTSPRPIPCPSCGWCNEPAARALRARRYRWMWELGLGLVSFSGLGLALGLLLAFLIEDLDAKKRAGPTIAVAVAGALFASGVVLLALRKVRERGFDPNRDIPDDERLTLGRTRALTQSQYDELMAANAEPPAPRGRPDDR